MNDIPKCIMCKYCRLTRHFLKHPEQGLHCDEHHIRDIRDMIYTGCGRFEESDNQFKKNSR
jgi:hypothetical protein